MGTRKRCPLCKVCYPMTTISRHIKTHSKERKLKCIYCNVKCWDKLSLHSHVKLGHTEQKKEPCPLCHRLILRIYVQDHIKRVHSKRGHFVCKKCNEKYRAKSTLWNHIKIKHNNQGKEQCNVCKRYYSFLSITKHVKSHSNSKRFHCVLCDSSFSEQSTLRKHNRMKHGNKQKQQCPICKIRVLHLQLHMKKQHSQKRTVVSCTTCQATFANKGNLRRHEESHKPREKQKLFPCPTCNREFLHKEKLQRHMSSHTEQHKQQCTKCKKYVCDMESHLETHLDRGKRPSISCPICMRKLVAAKRSLKHVISQHMSIHNMDRKLVSCKVCKATFVDERTLRRHMLTHNKDRPIFQCPKCPRKYYSKPVLNSHMNIHLDLSKRQRFFCEQCPKEFTSKNCLIAIR